MNPELLVNGIMDHRKSCLFLQQVEVFVVGVDILDIVWIVGVKVGNGSETSVHI